MKYLRMLSLLLALLLLGCSVLAEEAPVYENKEDWMNILLLGCDSYTKNDYQRSDSMIILSVNLRTSEMKMTSLLRDTWIKTTGHKARKLTELCAIGGPELTMQAINENFDMDLTKYALISMDGIAEIIDLLGGIDIAVTKDERWAINKGLFDLSSLSGMEKLEDYGDNVHLNGNQATAYARIRRLDNDYVRTERQRTVLMAMAKKLKEGANTDTLLTIVETMLGYVKTNLNLIEIMSVAGTGLSVDLAAVEQLRIPADGAFTTGMKGTAWAISPNYEKNTRILHDFIYG